MFSHPRLLSKICGLGILCASLCACAHGKSNHFFLPQAQESVQENHQPAPRLTQSGLDEFEETLKQKSQQMGVVFVVEGMPLRKTPLEHPANRTSEAVPQSIADWAQTYDYEAVRVGAVFVLKKRYTEPDDIPLVTLGECRLALRDGLSLLSRFVQVPPPQLTVGPVTAVSLSREQVRDAIFSSLSDQSWQKIVRSGGVRLSELNEAQQQNIVRYALDSSFRRTSENTLGTAWHLDILALRKPTVGFRTGGGFLDDRLKDVNLFGYEYLTVPQNYPMFRPQNHPDFVICDATRVASITIDDEHDKTKVANKGKDETEPDAQDFVFAQLEKHAPTIYLSEAVNRLNEKREKSKEPHYLPYSVDPTLADKPVLVVGDDKAAPEEVFQALAAVYGLRVVRNEKGEERITRLRPAAPSTTKELSAAMATSLPLPLQKVLSSEQKPQKVVYDSGLISSRDADMQFHIATVKHLRAATEPIIKAAKDGKVALNELGPEASRDLAVALLTTDYVRTIRELQTHRFPEYLGDMNKVALSGTRTQQPDGSVMYTLAICEVKADGKVSPRFTFSNFAPAPQLAPNSVK